MKRLAGQPFAIVGVNSDASPEALRKTLEEKELPWTNFFDGGGTDGPIATRWGVKSWPKIYVLDAAGVIRFHDKRGLGLDLAVDRLLAELDEVPPDQSGDGGR